MSTHASQFTADSDRLSAMFKECREFATARGWLFNASALAINPEARDDEVAARHLNSVCTSHPKTAPKIIKEIAVAFYQSVVAPAQLFADAVDADIDADLRARGFGKGGVS